MPKRKKLYKLHPIQLLSLDVLELFIKLNRSPDPSLTIKESDFSLQTGHSEYDEENHIMRVAIKLEMGLEEDLKAPFSMKIHLGGVFKIDESKFHREHIEDWAKRNAPLILYPYLREHAFALTARCGFRAIILPLLEVPTFLPPRTKKNTTEIKS